MVHFVRPIDRWRAEGKQRSGIGERVVEDEGSRVGYVLAHERNCSYLSGKRETGETLAGKEGGECWCNGEKSMYRGMKRMVERERGEERERESKFEAWKGCLVQ